MKYFQIISDAQLPFDKNPSEQEKGDPMWIIDIKMSIVCASIRIINEDHLEDTACIYI
jgi:hypothetical protein